MVKFGKLFKCNRITEWEREYIDYKSLKRQIKVIRSKHVKNSIEVGHRLTLPSNVHSVHLSSPSTGSKNNQYFEPSSSTPSMGNPELDELSIIFNSPNGNLLQEFFHSLDLELKKVYLFYINLERELYLQINSHLHHREKYKHFDMIEIYKEFDALAQIGYITKSFCFYINDNMNAIKNILKKIDRIFKGYYGSISLTYLRKKLTSSPNSDFGYMLQFKIIDEISALLEDMMKDLREVFCHVKECPSRKKSEIEISKSVQNNDHLGLSLLSLGDREIMIKIEMKIEELRDYLCKIDETETFRTKHKDWNYYIRNGVKIMTNHIKVLKREAARSFMVAHNLMEENLLKKLVSQEAKKEIISNEGNLSKCNRINIFLCISHSFLYLTMYSMCLSTNSEYLQKLRVSPLLSGVILGCTPLAAIVSTIGFSFLTNKYFKYPFILSQVFFITGSFLYSLGWDKNSVLIIASGRLFLGLGSARMMGRRYLIQFVSKPLIAKFSIYYVTVSAIGLAFGPIISILIEQLPEAKMFSCFTVNKYTYPGWIGVGISLLFLLVLLIFYTDPRADKFTMIENSSFEGNISKNTSIKQLYSTEEKNLINKIDDNLKEMNNQNQFSDTNLIPKSLEIISKNQKYQCNYISKCFFILFFVLLTIRFTNESLLVICPYYLQNIYAYSTKFTAYFMSGGLVSIFPAGLLLKKLNSKVFRERRMLVYFLSIALLGSLLIIDILIRNIWLYLFCFILLIIMTNIIETLASSLMAKIIPPDWELGAINTGFVISLATVIGRSLGCFMLTISGELAGNKYINLITYGISAILYLTCIILFLLNYSDLRVKAISRIMKTQIFEKI